ncbi:MAG: peptidase dimerization domain-containing protein, partial [Candidatus Magasanikbacteria bacterium]|nr:peptidase dimerization domain-containing protein [Candidatus Magasanikbacteria bacterium]
MDLKVTFFGKSFHSSKTSTKKNKSSNAINKAAAAITALSQLEIAWEKNSHSLFGPPTQAVCLINGGTAGNVIPDKCEISISRRFLPSENPENILKEIKQIMSKLDGQTKVETRFIGQSNLLRDDSPLLSIAKTISQKILRKEKIIVAPYWTQAGNFKLWGDCLIWGPGEVKMAHQAKEYCTIKQVSQMVECYKMLIQGTNNNLKKIKKSSPPGSPS